MNEALKLNVTQLRLLTLGECSVFCQSRDGTPFIFETVVTTFWMS